MRAARALVLAGLISGLCLSAVTPSAAAAAEFRVNTFPTGDQTSPSIAALSGGGFVVVWSSAEQDGEGLGIYGQRYAANGTKAGGEFRVNTFTDFDQAGPSVAGLTGGGFVVVWSSRHQDGSNYGAYGQRYSATGTKVGGEFRVNTVTLGDQADPAIAGLPNNTFVVTWTSDLQDGSSFGIYGQRYAANGAKAGAPFPVNTYTTSSQSGSAVSIFGTNSFVVVWSSLGQDGSSRGVYGQRYAASGAKIGGEFRVNTATDGAQTQPAITRLNSGGFVVAFASERGSAEVLSQRFTPTGVKTGLVVRVNTYTNLDQAGPTIAGTKQGGFVVAWRSSKQDGSGNGVYGQRYTAAGARSGVEFPVNETKNLDQELASVAPWSNGFILVWASDAPQDGSGSAVIGRRFPN